MMPAILDLPNHIPARLVNLAFNVGFATTLPGLPVWSQGRSILGNWSSRVAPPNGYTTEFEELHGRAGLQTLVSAFVPFASRVVEKRASGPLPVCGTSFGDRAGEKWFFINGICTDQRLALLNANTLAAIFGRPIIPLYNSTDSVFPDLFECAAGKGFDTITEAVSTNLMPLVKALCADEVQRVVLVGHSQGTIIGSIMIKWLDEILPPAQAVAAGAGAQTPSPERRAARRLAGKHARTDPNQAAARRAEAYARKHGLTRGHIGKLEVYCFANCSTSMTPIAAVGAPLRHAPWIESYGNENDLVARLGVLAPPHGVGSARIDGDRYRCEGAWGHLLNAHYLNPMLPGLRAGNPAVGGLKPFPDNLLQVPRLWSYYAGAQPPWPYP
jgi:hypothetical protein